LSLFACVLERTPIVWKLWRKTPHPDTSWLKDVRSAIVRDVSADTHSLRARLGTQFDWRVKSDDVWVGEHGRLALWGPLGTHLGMLLLAVGSLVTSFGSFTAREGGYAGERVRVEGMPFEVRVDSFRIQYYPLQAGQYVLAEGEWVGKIVAQNSDSSWAVERWVSATEKQKVALWDYDLTNHWDNGRDRGNIQKFTSFVTIFEDSEQVDQREIAVNSPLRRAGYRLYQSSYDPDNPKVVAAYDSVTVQIMDTLGTALGKVTLRQGQSVKVPGDTLTITAGEILPNFKMDAQFHAYAASADFINPAVSMSFRGPNGFEKTGWSFTNFSGHGRVIGRTEYKIETLHGPRAAQELATIFEIKKTIGTELLWLGFLICSLGLILSFYVTHRVLYVEWPTDAHPHTRVIGLSRKTIAMYEHELDRLIHSAEQANPAPTSQAVVQ
jgi:cytochrome c biogenesis protein ResB